MQDMAHSICLMKLYQTTMRKKFQFFVSDYHNTSDILMPSDRCAYDRVATAYLYANSSRFQYIVKYILKMLSIFSKCFQWERSGRRHDLQLPKVIAAYSWGSGGAVSPSAGRGQSPGGGPGDEGPGSTEDLAFYNIKNRLKNHLCCAFFCVLLCVL